MNRDEIQTAILQVCKVSGNDSDFNVLGFYALCDRLVELGATAEREACATLCDGVAGAAKINTAVLPESHHRMVAADDCADLIRARGRG
jgi:hypothetical protein